MNVIRINYLQMHHKEAIFRLWNSEYPQRLRFGSLTDVDAYLNDLKQAVHFFAEDENNNIAAWALVFEREEAIWFAIIVSSTFQKTGLGKQLLNILKNTHTVLNGWVIDHDRDQRVDGRPYPSPLAFYLKQDFVIHSHSRLETEKLSAVQIQWQKN